MRLTLAFSAPAELINANHRLHWTRKAQLTKAWRQAAFIHARWHTQLNHHEWPLERAHITVTIAFTDQRSRDIGNLQPTSKAIVDGLIDAGILEDDDDSRVIGPDNRRGKTTTQRVPQITVEIIEVDTCPACDQIVPTDEIYECVLSEGRRHPIPHCSDCIRDCSPCHSEAALEDQADRAADLRRFGL